jgi:hypothetical protein
MSVSRNSPCPCGSGKKYKKCCMAQDEKAAAEARHRNAKAQEQRLTTEAAENDEFIRYATDLENLSNRANDLIQAARWAEAEVCCRELLDRFPNEIDGHHRSYECFKAKGDFVGAKVHAQATLTMVESRDGFDLSFPARLKKDIARFDAAGQTDHPDN